MNQVSADKVIEQRLISNWGTTVIDINPNVPFNMPENNESFIKLNILNERTDRKNVGLTAIYRTYGTIIVRIYTPLNSGEMLGRTYADTISSIFRDQDFECIRCREGMTATAGEYEGRWQTNVVIPFYWDSDC